MSLTQGALLSICQGGNVEVPNLQVLSFKKISGNATDRYRLLVSDGMYSNSYAMLATQLNSLITDKVIDDFAVIRVNKFQCNTMQGKKVIIILDLDILKSGAQVGQKIGSPVAIGADGSVSENDRRQAMANNSGQKAVKRSGDESNQQPAAKKPLQATQNRPSMLNSVGGGGSEAGAVYPIASLTPYQNKWTIKARVTHKSDIRRWSNSRGEGHLFSMDLVDESGEIRATAFKEQCDKYYSMIEVGKVYMITHGTLKAANRAYSTLNNEYEMTFRDTTEVLPCTEEDTSSIPTLSFNFCQIGQLNAGLKDSTVDIIGVCKSAGDATTITSQRTQKELRKRDIVLVDKSLAEVNLTLWGTTADNFDASGNPVVALKGVKVSDYNGVSLSTLSSSVVQIDPDLPQGHELKGWYEAEGSSAQTSSLSTSGGSRGATGDFGSNMKTLGEVKRENLGANSDKGEYYSTVATITLIQKDKALYQACGNVNDGKSCNKKVQDQGNGMFRCEKCKVETENFNWRLILSFSVADATDNQWANCFQEQGESILASTSDELGALQMQDKAVYDRIFAAATFKKFNLRLRCKADFYNDEQRVRHTVISATPIDYNEYVKKLVRDLEEAGVPLPADFDKSKYAA